MPVIRGRVTSEQHIRCILVVVMFFIFTSPCLLIAKNLTHITYRVNRLIIDDFYSL